MFHQTVLQRPGDEEARLSRDKMPGEQVATYTARSPTQTSYQYSPPSRAQNSNPPTPAPPPLHSTFNNARNPPNSPTSTGLPPIASALYARETPSSNYYDPTQDPGDRSVGRNSDRFQSPFPAQLSTRDSYNYADSRSGDRNPYHSPVASTFPHHSPLPPPQSYPPPRPEPLAQSPVSPKMYHAFNRVNSSSYPSERRQSQDMAQPEGRPSTANKSDAATPSRKADPMSLSSIMSGTDHEPPSHVTKDASHSSNTYDAPPVKEEIVASPPRSKEVTEPHNVKPAMAPSDRTKRMHDIINGTPLPGPTSSERFKPDEREVEAKVAQIDAMDISDIDAPGFESNKLEYRAHSQKRTLEVGSSEESKRKRRRTANIKRLHDVFNNRAIYHKERYFKTHESEAWQEVQQQEIAEEKERKKDMQRKRRREKTLANESQKRAEALEKAEQAADEEEKQRLLKEAQKHDGRLKRTSQLLQQGGTPSKDIREVTPHAPNLEGGTMSTFQMSEDGPVKKRGRQGARPRKSKEQKQAEKDAAAAAQAAIDQGLTPQAIAPKEEARLSRLESIKRDRSQTEEASSIAPEDARPDFIPYSSDAYNDLYRQIWKDIGKAVPKVYRIKDASLSTKQSNLRKTAQLAAKEARRWQIRTNKSTKDVQARAKRSMREMLSFWKRNERDERDQRKMAERQELENAKKAEAEREANRQKRKLNFLISQTELFSHFVGKKVKTAEAEKSTNDVTVSDETVQPGDADKHTVDLPDSVANVATKVTNFEDLDFDAEDETALKQAAMANAQNAVQEAQDRALAFNNQGQADFDEGEMNFQNPTSLQNMDVAQPKMLTCQLKEYQLKGLNWLVNLYEQGINGILADEMGLGKTVQSISVMSYLAEAHNIWGPFLVIAPASTLHNWQQEITRFVPDLKVLPYWGNAKDRKVLRKFWDRKHITYRKESPFHVLVTSYQLVVQDAQYFQKIRWQYMVLDEAQAIKSSQSSRWKSLLGFHCRNRLLLTGTPIQNNMQELWALLHFIMPSLFDSHDEFNDWFSKDIESHAQSNTKLNEDQLKRLHMILKPFMLRRIKKHVQKELGDKIELDIFCDLTYRQRAYYTNLRNKISIMDLIEKAAVGDDQDTATLMNLVMQFRKVCNHPDLFERAETISPFSFSYFAETASFMREGHNIHLGYSVRNLIEYRIPRLVGRDSGRIYLAGPDNAKAGWRGKYLQHLMNIWEADHVLESSRADGAFSWLRFTDVSASEVCTAARKDIFQRAVDLRQRPRHLTRFKSLYDGDNKSSPMHALFNIRETYNVYDVSNDTKQGRLFNLLNVTTNAIESGQLSAIELAAPPGASAPPIELYCASQGVIAEKQRDFFSVPMQSALFDISTKTEEALLDAKVPLEKFPVTGMLPAPQARKSRYTHIQVPSMRRFVTDSGKLAKLDQLLKKLKNEGHRVLLYFQMTRMIDLMEEYLTYRNYKYCRLDGSTKLEDRRDTVADFQTRPDIFVFLLSTRAGGLGINLTSADTVIFYDSDWNPTIDSQAMDRAHRLGQTKQVTVYRLITRGTIEERIRKRALQKEEVQRVVISGGAGAHVDFNTRSRENRTKDIAMWLADDDQAELIERKEQELAALEASGAGQAGKKKRGGAAKRKADMSLDDMYHEGEGHFDDASAKPSGAATPVPAGSDAAAGAPPGKRRKGISKKAKTAKQRLAIADGMVDI